MAINSSILSRTLATSVATVLSFSTLAVAQRAGVPIHGVTGTLALPGNVDKIYDGLNTLIVKAADGTDHVIHVTKDTHVHGAEALSNVQRGTPVVVHYTVKNNEPSVDEIDCLGPEGLPSTEGTVTAVDRVRKTITVKYSGGEIERLRLTHHAAIENGTIKGNRVVVYYTNEAGQKVAHYFKRKS